MFALKRNLKPVRLLIKCSILTWTLLYSGGGLLEAIIASSFSQQTEVFYFTGKINDIQQIHLTLDVVHVQPSVTVC